MGYVFVYVLWTIAFLSVLIFSASYKIIRTRETFSTQWHAWSFLYESKSLARWGIYLAVNSPDLLRVNYGAPYYVGDRKYTVYIRTEEGKLSFFVWGPEVFERFLLEEGIQRERARAITNSLYRKIGEIKHFNELYYIKDIDPNTLRIIREGFTFVPTLTNINYASDNILKAVGLTQEEIDSIKAHINEKGFISFDEFMQVVNLEKRDIAYNFVFTPLPIYYRIKVVMEKPYRSSIVFVMSSDGRVYDAWQE